MGINARQDVRRYAAEQGITEDTAIEQGLQEKRKEFAMQGRALRQGLTL
jgi:hypothetical protein